VRAFDLAPATTAAGFSVPSSSLPAIIVTSGEPAGIGPDLCIELAARAWPCALLFAADPALLEARAHSLGQNVHINNIDPASPVPHHQAGIISVLATRTREPVIAGRLDVGNASYVLDLLDLALQGCLAGRFDAMVTAPVQKSVIADSGVAFSGHTEYLAQHSHTPLPVMLLVGGSLRVALATTHLPLKDVSAAITSHLLETVLKVLDHDLRRRFGILTPRIMVCGLNPHAGESGHLGREEIEVIAPVIERLRADGMSLIGPVPADTAFTTRQLERCDAVLAMFHDQGLPVLKHASFGEAVNVTLGLPFIRTSVDHGTALDLAGSGKADAGSLAAALQLAIDLAAQRVP
jgi:4-hydroxythreonine-4-phosphate dehydrogenase